MATTQLADIIYSEALTSYINQRIALTNAFLTSGVMANAPLLTGFLAGQGELFSVPHWNPLGGTPNAGSSDPAQTSTANKVTTGKQTARRLSWNNSWSVADLAVSLAADDPLRHVGDKLTAYWNEQLNTGVINTTLGILDDNQANDAGDMIKSVATDAAAAVTNAERISGDAVVDAMQTLGDRKASVSAIAMHSVPHSHLQKLGLLVDALDPQTGHVMYQTYLGKRVIIDDALPAVAGTNRITYTSVLFGGSAFGLGLGNPKVPQEVKRDPDQGNGAGVETVYSRRELIIHPTGFRWTEATMANETPTQTELADASNWDRSYERKNIPLAFLQTNG